MIPRRIRSQALHRVATSRASRRLRALVKSQPTMDAAARRLIARRPAVGRAVQRVGVAERTPNEITNQLVLDLVKRRRLDEAATVIETFLERNPRATRSYFIAGVVALYQSDFAAARRYIDQAYEMAWTVRDDLAQLPRWNEHVAAAAAADPSWSWPRYMIAKSSCRVIGTTPESLMLLIDSLEPPITVEFSVRFGSGRHQRSRPARRRSRVVVFESNPVGVRAHELRLSGVERSTVRRVPELARHAEIPGTWPSGRAAELFASEGITALDSLDLDAEFASADVLADVLRSGYRPQVITMALWKVALDQRLDAAEVLHQAGYFTQFDHEQMTAVSRDLVEQRRVHAWRTSEADFDGTLIDDYVSEPPADLASLVLDQLVDHQVRCFVTPVPEPHVTRISLGNPDKNFAISRILTIQPLESTIHVESLGSLGHGTPLVRLYLVDDTRRYRRSTVELDFWTERDEYLRTGNPNSLVTWIPAIHRERSMFALNPPFLLDDQERMLTMEARLGLAGSVLDTYDFDIDVVFTWVDGNDPSWQSRRRERQRIEGDPAAAREINLPDTSTARFRQRDELRYALRSVCSFMPYVRQIYIVTDRQTPEWLGEHPTVRVVDHSEIFEDPADLPCFNSNAIETNLHRIPGLAEHFVYFNDDVMLIGPTPPSAFFLANGVTRSFFESERSQYGPPNEVFHNSKNAVLNGSAAFSAHFGRTYHQYHRHTPFPLRRSLLEQMRHEFGDELRATSANHFRSIDDIAPISSLYQYYAFHLGAAVPSSIHARFLNLGSPHAVEALDGLALRAAGGVLCVNDNDIPPELEIEIDEAVRAALERLYPVPAPWERQ